LQSTGMPTMGGKTSKKKDSPGWYKPLFRNKSRNVHQPDRRNLKTTNAAQTECIFNDGRAKIQKRGKHLSQENREGGLRLEERKVPSKP